MEENRKRVNDLAKACACSADAAEWEEFVRLCRPLATLVASRISRQWDSGTSSTVVDDIVQEIFVKLCEHKRRILREFEPRGEDSFLGLLRIVSASVANDYFRRLRSAKRGGKVVTTPLVEDGAQIPVASGRQIAEMQRLVLFSQLDRKLGSAPETIGERDRSFFWLYYLQGLTAEEIARLFPGGLSAKGVESALRRVVKWLRGEVERRSPEDRAESG